METFPQEGGEGSFSYNEAIHRFSEAEKDIQEVQKQFPDLNIKFGAELEYIKEWMPDMSKFVKNTDFDFLIGSVHSIEGAIASSTEYCQKLFEGRAESEAYGKYFEIMYLMVEWGNFDVIGHLDVFKKGGFQYYGIFKPEKYKSQITEILDLARKKEIGIEINTSGLRSDCKEIFPHHDIIKWAVDIGIEHFTISSDAHETHEVGADLDKALLLAKEAGVKTLSTYTKRKPEKFEI